MNNSNSALQQLSGYTGGTLHLQNGQIVKHGFGVMRFATGATYRGHWKMGKLWGRGLYDWGDGNVFVGDFEDGKQHGQGKYCWPTGGCYTGGWNRDRMQGFGIYVRADGVKYIGTWKDDVQYSYGRKIVPVRVCWSADCVTTVERVFLEEWGEGKVLLSQREILIHPGAKMWDCHGREAFCDCLIVTIEEGVAEVDCEMLALEATDAGKDNIRIRREEIET